MLVPYPLICYSMFLNHALDQIISETNFSQKNRFFMFNLVSKHKSKIQVFYALYCNDSDLKKIMNVKNFVKSKKNTSAACENFTKTSQVNSR